MELLEEQIDDCLTTAKSLDPEGLKTVIRSPPPPAMKWSGNLGNREFSLATPVVPWCRPWRHHGKLSSVLAMQLDLNCDLGEGCAHDQELMPLITSANVACGGHAGDPATAFATLHAALRHGVGVGAHPSFVDREHFGRRELQRTEQQIFEDCVFQVGALAGVAQAVGLSLRHFKAHGALYNLACRDDHFARPLLAVAELFRLPILGLPGSRLEALSAGRVPFIAEGFADRRYRPDGTLLQRSQPDAFVEDPAQAVRQVEWLVRERGVRTVCVHGDNPLALAFVRQLRAVLTGTGVTLEAFAPTTAS